MVVYIDFSKAFDVVSHAKLIARLNSYGVRGTVLKWIENFLTGRTHCTKVDNVLSEIAPLISGVVQGSGIGPLMFLTYINELIYILEELGVMVKLFADDVKMYARIVNNLSMVQLQRAIDALTDWAREWQLGISVEKCCMLNIGTNVFAPELHIESETLSVCHDVRDLGIIVTDCLSPSAHVADVVSRAHRRAALILRAFTSRDIRLLLRAFIVYVRPVLEYNTVIWSPYTVHDIEAVESVQRCFTKCLSGFRQFPYEERLRRLDLQSLELRRLHVDLIWCYKVVFGLVDIDITVNTAY